MKIHLLIRQHYLPLKFFLTPGSVSDINALAQYDSVLLKSVYIFTGKAYTYYIVKSLSAALGILTYPGCKKNSKFLLFPWLWSLLHHYRNRLGTAGWLLPKEGSPEPFAESNPCHYRQDL